MVSLFSFLLHFQEFRQLLFLWKWDTVNSLQRFSLRITQPVCLRVLCDLESLRILRGGNVRTCTKVNEISNLKHTCKMVFWNLVLYQLCLKLIVLEQVQGLFLGQVKPFKWVIFSDYRLDGFLNLFVVIFSFNYLSRRRKEVIKESIFHRRTDCKLRVFKHLLDGRT